MVEIKWKFLKEAVPETKYLILAGFTNRRSLWTYLPYLNRSRKVGNQLNQATGLIGYTARMGFLSKELVNVTVWENESDLKKFTHEGAHLDCMEKTRKGLTPTEYVRWTVKGSQLPPTIDDACRRYTAQSQ
jgi:hypothetical protein